MLPVRFLRCEQDLLDWLCSSKRLSAPQSKPFPLPATGASCLTWDVLQATRPLSFNDLLYHLTRRTARLLSFWSETLALCWARQLGYSNSLSLWLPTCTLSRCLTCPHNLWYFHDGLARECGTGSSGVSQRGTARVLLGGGRSPVRAAPTCG